MIMPKWDVSEKLNFFIKTRSFWSAPLKAPIWENKQRWYGKAREQLNVPSWHLQDSQQIHNLNRFTKHSEGKNFLGNMQN